MRITLGALTGAFLVTHCLATPMTDAHDRAQRLAALGAQAAADILYARPGTAPGVWGAVPVVHLVFPERAFFDFDADQPRADSRRILEAVAGDVRDDSAHVVVTILGHTDAIGGVAYNIDLGRRRAASVLRALVASGASPDQLTIVAIGKAQPIASNATADGRALNRRVEFLFSPSLRSNLDVVARRDVNPAFLDAGARAGAAQVDVYGGRALLEGAEPGVMQELVLRAPASAPVRRRAPAPGAPAPVLNTPEPIEKRPLEPQNGKDRRG